MFLSLLLGFGSTFGMDAPTKEMRTAPTQLYAVIYKQLFGIQPRKPRRQRKGRFASSANLQVKLVTHSTPSFHSVTQGDREDKSVRGE